MNQIAIPVEISCQELRRERSLGGSIDLCIKAAGYEPKEVQDALKLDKAQVSRWVSGGEGIVWPKLKLLMDHCGNDAPVLWQLHDRGWDIETVRRLESETQRENRQLREENAALRRVLTGAGA